MTAADRTGIDRIREAYATRVTRAEQTRTDDVRKARTKRAQVEQDIQQVAGQRAQELYDQLVAKLRTGLEALDAGTRAALAHTRAECATEEDRAERVCHEEVEQALKARTEAVIALYKPPETPASRYRDAAERGTIGGTEETGK